MCRNEIIIMMERERVLSWPELCLTGSWPALPLATLTEIQNDTRLKGRHLNYTNLFSEFE